MQSDLGLHSPLLCQHFLVNETQYDVNQLFTTRSRLLKTLRKKLFENIVGKGENADKLITIIFSFSHTIFYPNKNRNHNLKLSANSSNLVSYKNCRLVMS